MLQPFDVSNLEVQSTIGKILCGRRSLGYLGHMEMDQIPPQSPPGVVWEWDYIFLHLYFDLLMGHGKWH